MGDTQTDRLQEKCAVFGAYNVGPGAARLTFYGLWALQHRGQESSGIVSSDGKHLHRHVAPGLVANVYREEDLEQLPGSAAIGHNRYATSGAGGDAHGLPSFMCNRSYAFAHNGNLPVTKALEGFLDEHEIDRDGMNDSEMMGAAIGYYLEQGMTLEKAIIEAFPMFTGTFSSVAIGPNQLAAFRDECGIRPLSIGRLDKGYIVASETCAFDTVGATFIRDVKPGELVIIDKKGLRSHQVVAPRSKLDIFELVYFARPDSMIMGKSVNEVRKNLGRELAKEYKLDADIVVPVPDSAIPAALGYAQASGIPFEMGLIKNRYIHRTFITPTQKLRRQHAKMKLNPMPDILRGKRVVLVDDSIVRGTTTQQITHMLYDAGAKEVHILVSSPPVLYPDFYGINTPDQKELIAARMSVDEIRKHLGADSLGYLSYQGMVRATGQPASVFSTSCFTGVYPVPIGERKKEFAHVG